MEKPILTKHRNVFFRAEIHTEKKNTFSTVFYNKNKENEKLLLFLL